MKLENIIIDTFALQDDFILNDSQGPGDIQGWDSLGHVNLMNALERYFSISLDMDDMISIENILDIKAILKNKGIKDFD